MLIYQILPGYIRVHKERCARSGSVCSTAYVYTDAYVYTYTVLHTPACSAEVQDECGWGGGAGLGKHAMCGHNKDFTIRNSEGHTRMGADVENLRHRLATSSGTQ